jgi:hypothetical protein
LGMGPGIIWTSKECQRAGLWLERSGGFHV